MAETFSGTFKLSVNGTFSTDVNELSTVTQAFAYSKAQTFTNGTAADQANMVWSDQRTLGASPDDLDLAGSLTNAFGTTITFTSIKGIIVYAASGNSGDLTIGGDGTAPLAEWTGATTDTVIVKPGGMFALINPEADGYAVTATTADILQVSGTTSDVYDIILIGEV